ncbi:MULTISPECIES: hypothetical protein [Tenacibaculum]|uniref:hypothetical protein n=1 Tax=Tenacibaculum TaxID=104267 RepID=UPI0014312052|nr:MULTISPECIES: hypothetical protein [Tenacibaculum]KAF9659693.1 hypothetical protein HBA12_05475 [Tenacibaculum mesophilum]MCG7500276.1 hypothetical protein [Tenacibaculum sp. Mcav3-52]
MVVFFTRIYSRKLVLHIEAHTTLSENEAYPTLLNEIDVLAKQYNLVVDNRSKSSTPTTEEV